jgi:hypothetical protein
VKILVGDANKKEFSVHYDVICRKAPIFKSFLRDNLRTTHAELLKLPKVGAVIFELFMTWLYQDIIERPMGSSGDAAAVLTELIAFAENHDIPQLPDSGMDFLLKLMREGAELRGPENTTQIYRMTGQGSRLRNFNAKSLVYKTLAEDGINDWKDDELSLALKGHKDALQDYIRELRMQDGVVQVDPLDLPACTFHRHGKDEPCPIASKKRKRASRGEGANEL